jgi:hypothetical protein
MSTEDWHALASSYVPNSASFVDRCSAAHISSELKLSTRYFSGMALEDMNGFAWFCIPNLSHKKSTMAVPSKEPVRILSPSALKFKDTISPSCPFNVECSFPVYRSQSLAQTFMGIKSNSNNLVLVTGKSVKQFSRISIPQLSGRVEASSHDFITK